MDPEEEGLEPLEVIHQLDVEFRNLAMCAVRRRLTAEGMNVPWTKSDDEAASSRLRLVTATAMVISWTTTISPVACKDLVQLGDGGESTVSVERLLL